MFDEFFATGSDVETYALNDYFIAANGCVKVSGCIASDIAMTKKMIELRFFANFPKLNFLLSRLLDGLDTRLRLLFVDVGINQLSMAVIPGDPTRGSGVRALA